MTETTLEKLTGRICVVDDNARAGELDSLCTEAE